ncbi:MAG TPA: hypothetical protein VFC44_03580 [Candidatus Saccharimonadales bacterium]|nr:hypothetical protein [Candidatus Saccharimonadales bacterium]
MKIKTLLPAIVLFFLTSTMFAADKQVIFEIRASQTVDFSKGTFEFVAEHSSEGGPLKLAVLRKEGTTNILQETVVPSTVYKEHRYAVIISPEGGRKGVSQVFRLPMRQNSKPSGWSQWQKPDYIENSKYVSSNFMDDVKSPDRSTNIPPDCFEVRYKIEDSK